MILHISLCLTGGKERCSLFLLVGSFVPQLIIAHVRSIPGMQEVVCARNVQSRQRQCAEWRRSLLSGITIPCNGVRGGRSNFER